jgi:hypothetical protein
MYSVKQRTTIKGTSVEISEIRFSILCCISVGITVISYTSLAVFNRTVFDASYDFPAYFVFNTATAVF